MNSSTVADADGSETRYALSSYINKDNGVLVVTEDSKTDENSALIQKSIAKKGQESAPVCDKSVSEVLHKSSYKWIQYNRV